MAETLEAGGELKNITSRYLSCGSGNRRAHRTQASGKSTDNTIMSNAQTAERDFIVDHAPTTIERYAPSLSRAAHVG